MDRPPRSLGLPACLPLWLLALSLQVDTKGDGVVSEEEFNAMADECVSARQH